MASISAPGWIIRFIILVLVFIVFFSIGAMAVAGLIPAGGTEPGLVPPGMGIFIIAVVNTLLVIWLVLSSRWSGWKLVFWLAFSYYGIVTFMTQVETWYFLSGVTVETQLLPALFIMGLPVAVFFIPLAVWMLGGGKSRARSYFTFDYVAGMSLQAWLWRFAVIAVIYVILYWTAGYYISWQNPELRAFYGSPDEILPFWMHTLNTLQGDYGLFLFQGLRGVLWTLFALPIIRGSRMGAWGTALLVGLFLSVPVNIIHIIENPLMPLASVRFSHMVETGSSNFLFGMIITGLLHREHRSPYWG